MQDKFIEASKKERFCLKNILPRIKSSKYNWTEYITDIYSYDVYDCLLQANIDGVTKKRFIVEVKLRDTHFGELILETKKLNDLKRIVFEKENTDILYINITPNGTYIFNITQIEKKEKLNISKLVANKATMQSRKEKIEKNVILLNVEDARYIDYKFNFNDYIQTQREIENINNKHKARKDMFDWLLKKD